MMTLEMGLNRLVATGQVSYDDAVLRALYPNEIERPAPAAAAGRFRR